MRRERAALMAAALAALAVPAAAQAPMSAIDWLSDLVATPPAAVVDEPPVSTTAATAGVTTSVLGAATTDAAGLLPPATSGLPRGFWGLARIEDVLALVATDRSDALPAVKALYLTLLLAELDPPADGAADGRLLLARIDALLSLGALDQARALIEAAGPPDADRFRRLFDIALLTGHEDAACTQMVQTPSFAPSFKARIFCLARSGDWNAAALSLRTGVTLGYLDADDEALMSRFLDPDLYEGEGTLPPPARVTPLDWRMLEAIGETLPTGPLPVAFAHAELRDSSGWKARIEAAERLTRAGVVEPSLLLGLYTERSPAASGGVWDRVEAFQTFETALAQGDLARVSAILPELWTRMTVAELDVPFASLFAGRLIDLPLTGPAAEVAFHVALLSPDYARAAAGRTPLNRREAFLVAVALDRLAGASPVDELTAAVLTAFVAPDPGAEMTALADDLRLGEAMLRAIDRLRAGAAGDLRGVTEGLSLLNRIGFEEQARRIALNLLLIQRRG